MFDQDALRQRGQALEDEFFHRVDEQLRSELRNNMERDISREQLADATGFQDQELLDHFLDGGFEATTLAALALVPAVFVAWADGTVSGKERQAVLKAALQRGLDHQPMALQMVEGWLHKRPPRSLWKLWKEYARAVHDSISPTLSQLLMKEILRQSREVAKASDGTLGFGKVSAEEQAILDEISNVYT